MTAKKKLTFEDICKLEPEIHELYQEARRLREKKNTYEIFHRRIKPNLTLLVGEHAKHAKLRTFEAYEVALDKIMRVLDI
jgi:hypothetical protein